MSKLDEIGAKLNEVEAIAHSRECCDGECEYVGQCAVVCYCIKGAIVMQEYIMDQAWEDIFNGD